MQPVIQAVDLGGSGEEGAFPAEEAQRMALDINSDLLAPTPHPIRCTLFLDTLLLPL